MDTWSLPKARPISCNDCPAFQRDHMSVRWFAESFTRLPCVINTTFREKIYSRWCCNDRLSWQDLSESGPRTLPMAAPRLRWLMPIGDGSPPLIHSAVRFRQRKGRDLNVKLLRSL